MGYGLTNKKLIGRKFYLTILTITMFFGGGLIPNYMLWKWLHLTNTFGLYVIPGTIGAFSVIVMRTFFTSTIHPSIEESAKVEGANEINIFFRLIIPMSTPLLATFALFAAVGHWNDWFTGEFFIQNVRLHPLSTVLRRMIAMTELVQNMMNTGMNKYVRSGKMVVSAESVKMAAIMVTVVPVILVYPYLQKYFIHGMVIGSIKG
jgi:putative aldouronate transport system permease protein